MSFLHSWLCKQNGGQYDGPSAVDELGGPVIPGWNSRFKMYSYSDHIT